MFDITHIVTTIDRGGAEKHLLELAAAQVRTGLKVRVIFLKGGAELLNNFESANCSVHPLLANKNFIFQILALRKILKDERGVIHAHLPRAELISAFCSSSKLVVTRHNAEKFFPKAPKFLSRLLSRYVASKSYACIGISNSVKEFLSLSKEWPTRPEVTVIHYGVQSHPLNITIGKNQLLRSLEIPSSSKIIGTIARVVPQKDYPTLLQAFKIVNREFSDSYLIAVGEGYLQATMDRLAIEMGISEHIRWVGKVENVDNFLQLFDCFILTSLYEGFGLVLLEAANANLPIIASNISAIPEVLGVNYKYLASPGDHEQFARFILESLSTEATSELCEFNHGVMDRFTLASMTEKTIATYNI